MHKLSYSILVQLTILLGGCGFELRGNFATAPEFTPICIQAPSDSQLVSILHDMLQINGVPYTQDPKAAGFILHIVTASHSTRVSTVNSYGKVIGSELTYRVVFEGTSSQGTKVIASQTIEVAREYINPEVEVLGKIEEADMIRRELERVLADRMLRRIRPLLRRGSA